MYIGLYREPLILTNRRETTIRKVNMTFLRRDRREIGRDRIRNELLVESLEIQKLSMRLEEKQLQLFRDVKRIDIRKIPRRESELKCEGKKVVG
jgi:hypothetical protein